jgi:hypothetical protein
MPTSTKHVNSEVVCKGRNGRTKLILTRVNTFLDRSLSVSKVLRLEYKRMNEALDNAMSPVIELG